jgi:hypothetical protein
VELRGGGPLLNTDACHTAVHRAVGKYAQLVHKAVGANGTMLQLVESLQYMYVQPAFTELQEASLLDRWFTACQLTHALAPAVVFSSMQRSTCSVSTGVKVLGGAHKEICCGRQMTEGAKYCTAPADCCSQQLASCLLACLLIYMHSPCRDFKTVRSPMSSCTYPQTKGSVWSLTYSLYR